MESQRLFVWVCCIAHIGAQSAPSQDNITIMVNPHVLMKQASAFRSEEKYQLAQKYGRLAIQGMFAGSRDHPDLPRMLILQAINEAEEGCFRDAVALYRLVKEEGLTQREKVVVRCNLGFCYQNQGEIEKARTLYYEVYERAEECLPKNAFGQYLLSLALLEHSDGQTVKAQQHIANASTVFGDNKPIRYWMTVFDVSLPCRPKEARHSILLAVDMEKTISKKEKLRLLERRGKLALFDGDRATAIQYFKDALQISKTIHGDAHPSVVKLKKMANGDFGKPNDHAGRSNASVQNEKLDAQPNESILNTQLNEAESEK